MSSYGRHALSSDRVIKGGGSDGENAGEAHEVGFDEMQSDIPRTHPVAEDVRPRVGL